MRKILFTFTIIILIGLGVWFWAQDKDVPIVETIVDVLPFGSGEDVRPTTDDQRPTTDTGKNEDISQLGSSTSKLMLIADAPVAGFVAYGNGASTTVRYVDRATGHIYDFNLTTIERAKVTNETRPKIYEAHFRPDGNAVLLRYLKNNSDTIENLSLTLTPPKATSTLYGVSSVLLRGNISGVNASGNNLAYILKDSSSIVTSLFNGSGLKTLINSAFSDWQLKGDKKLVAYTKPASSAEGYAYLVSNSLNKVLGPLNGLVANINPSGDHILYSYIENGEMKLAATDLNHNLTLEVLPTTLADKCVWSDKVYGVAFCGVPVGGVGDAEPDSWFRGVTHFSDNIWRFGTDTDIAEVLLESEEFDVYKPSLSPDEKYFVFINKNDLSLWAFKLE